MYLLRQCFHNTIIHLNLSQRAENYVQVCSIIKGILRVSGRLDCVSDTSNHIITDDDNGEVIS